MKLVYENGHKSIEGTLTICAVPMYVLSFLALYLLSHIIVIKALNEPLNSSVINHCIWGSLGAIVVFVHLKTYKGIYYWNGEEEEVHQEAPGRVFLSCKGQAWVGNPVVLPLFSLLTLNNNNQMPGSVTGEKIKVWYIKYSEEKIGRAWTLYESATLVPCASRHVVLWDH